MTYRSPRNPLNTSWAGLVWEDGHFSKVYAHLQFSLSLTKNFHRSPQTEGQAGKSREKFAIETFSGV
jgi:hypothetical protein